MTKNPASEGSNQDLMQIKNPGTVGPKGEYDPKNFMPFLDKLFQFNMKILLYELFLSFHLQILILSFCWRVRSWTGWLVKQTLNNFHLRTLY